MKQFEGVVEETLVKPMVSKRDRSLGRHRAKIRAERRAIGAAEQYRKDVELAIKHGRPWDSVTKPKAPAVFKDPHHEVAFHAKLTRANQLITRAERRKRNEPQSND